MSGQFGRRQLALGQRVIPWLVAAAAAALLCAGTSAAASPADACPPSQAFGDCALSGVVKVVQPSQCPSDPEQSSGQASEPTTIARLQRLIEQVPCPDSGRVSFATVDDHHDPMAVLDVLQAPGGGYLGVYHTAFGPSHDALDYRVSLASSRDLMHWHRLVILDPSAASMPTLRAIPGQPGFLLAYEKAGSAAADHVIRLRYYRTSADLLAGRYTAQRSLPLRFSPYNNGTPSILSIRWRGGLGRSAVVLGFHYESVWNGGEPGPDREATGTLYGFRRWLPRPDFQTDFALDQDGFEGSHGDWRQFDFETARWRLYEAQTAFNDFSSWHVLLSSPSSRALYRLTLRSGDAPVTSSFGNPVAQELPAPSGRGQVLVVTMFLFTASVPDQAGELVYYQPI